MEERYKLYKHINIIFTIIGAGLGLLSYMATRQSILLFGILVVFMIFNRQAIRIRDKRNERVIKLSYLSFVGLIYLFVINILNTLYWHFNPNNIKTAIIIVPGIIIVLIPQVLCRIKK